MTYYIMVTHWKDHWEGVNGKRTYYTKGMLKGVRLEELKDNTPTIFIKVNAQTKEIESVWRGVVSDIRVKDDEIWFTPHLHERVEGFDPTTLPIRINFGAGAKPEGWYACEELMERPLEREPPFFNILRTTKDHEEFEKYSYLLLKLLGIHTIAQYPREEQRGKADGFFTFKNLSVLWDATLEQDYESKKAQQIDNYVEQLKKGRIAIKGADYAQEFEVPEDHARQVWIITRGKLRPIKESSGVLVKEVPIDSLIQLYHKRLDRYINEERLQDELKNL